MLGASQGLASKRAASSQHVLAIQPAGSRSRPRRQRASQQRLHVSPPWPAWRAQCSHGQGTRAVMYCLYTAGTPTHTTEGAAPAYTWPARSCAPSGSDGTPAKLGHATPVARWASWCLPAQGTGATANRTCWDARPPRRECSPSHQPARTTLAGSDGAPAAPGDAAPVACCASWRSPGQGTRPTDTKAMLGHAPLLGVQNKPAPHTFACSRKGTTLPLPTRAPPLLPHSTAWPPAAALLSTLQAHRGKSLVGMQDVEVQLMLGVADSATRTARQNIQQPLPPQAATRPSSAWPCRPRGLPGGPVLARAGQEGRSRTR